MLPLYFWEHVWPCLFLTFIRPMLKWVVGKVTGQCELLRLSYRLPRGANRTFDIEYSLHHSKTRFLKQILVEDHVDIENAVTEIMKIKAVKLEVHSQFKPILETCLGQICGYRQLIGEVEAVRKTQYNPENDDNEQLLMQLWNRLMPDTPLESRITKQWDIIGFQGDDPKTDFRGMGMLGLLNLCFFAEQFNADARKILSQSHHPQHGFSFAIVGINLTQLAHQLLMSGALKSHLYNLVQGKPKLVHFHQVYCYLFCEFSKFWFEEKPNIMEFNSVRDRFNKVVRKQLQNKTCILRTSFMSTLSPQNTCS